MTDLPFPPQDLQTIVEQIESLEAEKKTVSRSIKTIYEDAKETGLDVKAIRAVIRLRRKSQDEREQEESVLTSYLQAIGMCEAHDTNHP